MTRCVRLSGLLTLAAALVLTSPALGQATVQRIELEVTIDGPPPHAIIRERLRATVQSVIERLLAGRPLDQLTILQPRLGETIASVVDRVATGYAVSSTSVRLGVTSEVVVRLQPLGPLIREAEVVSDLRAVHSRLHALVAFLSQQSPEPEIRALFTGLPQAALAWAQPILESQAREAVERALAGFTAAVRARVRGESAQVEVVLAPRDTRVIRNIGVRFRSSSIPTMLLDQHNPAVASMAEPLRGLPVAFAQAHRSAIEALIKEDLTAYPPARQYGIIATPALDVAETTFVTVVADSVVYRARVEAQLNVGAQAPGPAVVGHLGRLIASGTEAFVELRLVPTPLSMDWHAGAQITLSPSTAVGASYAIVARETTVWTAVRAGLDTGVRASWNLGTDSFEGALTYRFNEFLSGELIATSRGLWWLRLVSNL